MIENKNLILNIEGVDFSPKNPLIIAELGTSHGGKIEKAKALIDAAAKAGAGCIKVQMVFAGEILHPNTGVVPLPGGEIRLYDQFKALEMNAEFYIEIKKYTEAAGLLFLCTPFGMKSASILRKMQPKMVKIASPELNFTSLLEEIATWNLPVLLSAGVSRLSDIETAVAIFREEFTQRHKGTEDLNVNAANVCILHCVTSYPAPETDYNLRLIPNLSAIFGVPVGVSDHSADPELIPALAVSLGAAVVEKHFCLSKDDPGLDDPIALEPQDFSKMTEAIRQAAQSSAQETISHYSRTRGQDLVQQILGSGIKELAPSEKANYKLTNRSIHALRDIQKDVSINILKLK